jgi:cyclopropane-fatty-acyl-phospholipid synthase
LPRAARSFRSIERRNNRNRLAAGGEASISRSAAHGDRARFILRDYREQPGPFERIVSVGMFEHVGAAHYREYFRKVKELLTDDGIMLLHSIGRM